MVENSKKYLFTSESVTEGHPDKICDQISDAILDEHLKQDENARVACECAIKNSLVYLFGEITSKAKVDHEKIVKRVIKNIGYDSIKKSLDYKNVTVITNINEQSEDIKIGVEKKESLGAGDQGIMFGYATNETKELMPLPIILAHKLALQLSNYRKKKAKNIIYPDGKTQVTIEYENEIVKRIHTILISTQHSKKISLKKLKSLIKKNVVLPVIKEYEKHYNKKLYDKNTILLVNPTGKFTIGGPKADAGLTGRKIIVDTYGGFYHGGGAFSGKDPSKVDRSATYMARYIAKNIVKAGLAKKILVQLSYAIGMEQPISIYVDTYNTNKISEEKIVMIIRKVFSLTPKGIIESLNLKKPIFRETSVYGHFGRKKFSWEKTDKVKLIKKLAQNIT